MESMNESTAEGLRKALRERQREIWAHLPKFVRTTSLIAFAGMIITSIIQSVTNTTPSWRGGTIFLSNPTLGSVITLLLSFVSILVMWIFVIWSIFFIPFVGYQAIKASQKLGVSQETKSFKWVQLGISILIPLVTFALIWNSAANVEVNTSLHIESGIDAILVVIGIVIVISLLTGINKLVPPHLVNVRVSLLSFMLYTTLFLTYGWGVGLASNSMLFGVLIYLMFGMNDIGQLARRITIYDIDTKAIDSLDSRDELLRKRRQVAELGYSAQIEIEEYLLDMLQTRFHQLRQTFELLSKEASDRFDDRIQYKIIELEKEAKELSLSQLSSRISVIMAEIDQASHDIPQALQLLREKVIEAGHKVIEAGQQYQMALQNFDQQRPSLLIEQRQHRQELILSTEINVAFERLRSIVANHSGIRLQTKDQVLRNAGNVQNAFLEALSERKYNRVESLITRIKQVLDKLVKDLEQEKIDQHIVKQPELFAQKLDDFLKDCAMRLQR